MKMWGQLIGLAVLPALVHSFAPTDSTQDADPPQSGYLPNHNMDPAMVESSLTIAWKQVYNVLEMFYAKPLVYTPPGAANEQVIVVSNQNIIRVIDGMTGNLVNSRTLYPPFTRADAMCGDIDNFIGIIGTPIIDSATDIMYFFSKGYRNGQPGSQGTINGVYRFYAVKLPSLVDVFPPVLVDGHNADNDDSRYFIGGTVLQRPGLAMVGDTVIGGFGGHCDKFNYTGMLVAVSKTPGVGVVSIQAMMAAPFAPKAFDIMVEGSGKAGIWQYGMALASDNDRVFLVTGNGRSPGQNKGQNGAPASGKTYLSTCENAVVDYSVSPSGVLTQADYFEPYAYDSLNGGDRDFGSSGVALLDGSVFNGGGVNRVAIAGGKDGHVYIMDADNLGGFAGGNAGSDNVLQTITNSAALLSGVGSYPLEGGYIYISPSGQKVQCWKFSRGGDGKPQFTLAGQSVLTFNGKSVPTVTTNKGKPGSGIVWLADNAKGLVAFKAVPVGGTLEQITLPLAALTGGLTKTARAVFGNGRVYTTRQNSVIALGGGGVVGPAALACTPETVAFGQVSTGSTKVLTVTCTASTALTISGCSTSTGLFQCSSKSLPAAVADRGSFSFPVTFNLTHPNILAYQNKTRGPLLPGDFVSMLTISAKDSSNTNQDDSMSLTGTVVAAGGYLVLNQTSVDFGGAIVNGPLIARSIILSNAGSGALTFTGFAWQDFYNDMTFVNVTSPTVGLYYTSLNFPAVGSKIQPGASISIQLFFGPKALGVAASYLTFWSDGGYTDVLLTGNAQSIAVSSSSSSSMLDTSSSSSISPSSVISSSSVLSSPSSSSSSSSSVLPSSSSSSILTSSSVVSSSTSSTLSSDSTSPSAAASSSSSGVSSTADYSSSEVSSTSSKISSSSSSSKLSSSSSSSTLSSSSSSTLSSSRSSSKSSSSSILTTSSSSSSKGPSTNTASTTTTISLFTTLVTSTSTTPSPTSTSALTFGDFAHQGCFRDLSKNHALPLLLKNNSVTPELCHRMVQNLALKPTPTILPYFYLEYGRECYGGSSFTWAGSAVTSLTGKKACTAVCSGSVGAVSTGVAKCGGAKMFDLYVASGAEELVPAFTLTK